MYNNVEMDELTRKETAGYLYRYLTQCMEIPEHIRKHYGFDEDYKLLQRINDMDSELYRPRDEPEEFPDSIDLDAKITRSVERAYESICGRPPVYYLDKLNEELEMLGAMAYSPTYKDQIFYKLDFFAKYGIDIKSPREEQFKQIEKAYRELDARFVKMTGRRPYADDLFNGLKKKQSDVVENKPSRKPHIRLKPKSKGRKMGM